MALTLVNPQKRKKYNKENIDIILSGFRNIIEEG
jgi:hypothetical protein